MKVRLKKEMNIIGTANEFIKILPGKVLMHYEKFGGAESAYISDLEVYIEDEWKDLSDAFKNKDIITDYYNEWFFEPKDEEERRRGYRL